MDPRVVAAVARGDGLVSRSELHVLGFDPGVVAAWVRRGELIAVRRGVYTTAELWRSWDVYVERPLTRIRAAERVIAVPHVFSHDSSALLNRLPLLHPQAAEVHVTRRHLRGSMAKAGIHHHGARYLDHRATTVDGLPTLDVPRTVVDLSRAHGYTAGLVAADGAMQLGWTRSELAAAAAEITGEPFSLTVNAVVEAADPGAESVIETLSRNLLDELALGPVETQFPVRVPNGVAWVDLRVGRHLFEADGRIKIQGPGGAPLTDREREQLMWEQRRREREVCADGFVMTRFVYADFWGAARDRTIARVLADDAHAVRTFGTALPAHVEEFAARARGRRNKGAGLCGSSGLANATSGGLPDP